MIRCGAQRVMSNLIDFFLKQNNDIVLINDFPLPSDISQYTIDKRVKRYFLQSKNEGKRLIKNLIRILRLRTILKNEKPDLAVSFLGRPNIRFLIASRRLRIKKIVSIRNDPNHEYGTNIIKKMIINNLFRLADGVVFQTTEAKDYFKKLNDKKCFIVPNSVDPKFFSTKKKDNHNIVTFGRLEEQKNHALLIDAFCMIANDVNDDLLIFGTGSKKDFLEKKIRELGLENRIHLMGVTSSVAIELSKAKIFVLSSNYEGMPNALMEAMAVGLPCISTDCPCGGPRELIMDGQNGFLVPCNNKNALASAMKKMLLNEQISNDIAIGAKKTSQHFLPSEVNAKWQSVFMKIIEG